MWPVATPGPVTMFRLPFSARILSTAGSAASSASRLTLGPRSISARSGRAARISVAASAASRSSRDSNRLTSFSGVTALQHERGIATTQAHLLARDAQHLELIEQRSLAHGPISILPVDQRARV